MKRIIKVLMVTALMVVLMATSVSPAFAVPRDERDNRGGGDPDGWGVQNEPDGPEGHFDGVAHGGHEAGDPNGWWYVYDCGYTGQGPEQRCEEEEEEHGHRYS